jgi:hypothetical protein
VTKTSDKLQTLRQDFGRIEVATKMMEQLLVAENYSGATQVLPVLESELKGFSDLLEKIQAQSCLEEAKENQQIAEQK